MTRAVRRARASSTSSNSSSSSSSSSSSRSGHRTCKTPSDTTGTCRMINASSSGCSTALDAANGLTFPRKLAEMLEYGENVIVWSQHGLSFYICNEDALAHKLLPQYFRHNKITSFQRQLNLYGFRRITKGVDTGAYFHPQFRRDRPDLVNHIRRMPGQGATATAKFLPLYYKDVQNSAPVHITPTGDAADGASFAAFSSSLDSDTIMTTLGGKISSSSSSTSSSFSRTSNRARASKPRRRRIRSESSASNVSHVSSSSTSSYVEEDDDDKLFLKRGAVIEDGEGEGCYMEDEVLDYFERDRNGGEDDEEGKEEGGGVGGEQDMMDKVMEDEYLFTDPPPFLSLASLQDSSLSLVSDDGSHVSGSSSSSSSVHSDDSRTSSLNRHHQHHHRPGHFAVSVPPHLIRGGYPNGWQHQQHPSSFPSSSTNSLDSLSSNCSSSLSNMAHACLSLEESIPSVPPTCPATQHMKPSIRFCMPTLSSTAGIDDTSHTTTATSKLPMISTALCHSPLALSSTTIVTGNSSNNSSNNSSMPILPPSFSVSSFSQWLNGSSALTPSGTNHGQQQHLQQQQRQQQQQQQQLIQAPPSSKVSPLPSFPRAPTTITSHAVLLAPTAAASAAPSGPLDTRDFPPASCVPSPSFPPPPPKPLTKRCSSMSSELWRGWGSAGDLQALAELDTSIDDIFSGPDTETALYSAGGGVEGTTGGATGAATRHQHEAATAMPVQSVAVGLGAFIGITAA